MYSFYTNTHIYKTYPYIYICYHSTYAITYNTLSPNTKLRSNGICHRSGKGIRYKRILLATEASINSANNYLTAVHCTLSSTLSDLHHPVLIE